jgi:hypothetical protein
MSSLRIIEVALRCIALEYEIPLSINSLSRRREYGSVEVSAIGKRSNQTTNLGVRSSNLFGRATSLEHWERQKPDISALDAATRVRSSSLFGAHPDFEPWRLNLKALLCAATFAILVATPVLGADSVSLVGTWTGQRDRIAKVEGRRGGLATLVITEQQGNTFVGRLKRSNATGDEDEALWGAFTPGARLMIGSDEEGTYIFDLVDQNTLDYCYSETGASPRSVCARLTRRP